MSVRVSPTEKIRSEIDALFSEGIDLAEALEESSCPAALSALRQARAAGMTISVDPSSAAPLEAVGQGRFLEWTHAADLCIANLDEARVLAGPGTPREVARRLAPSAYREVVVKMGCRPGDLVGRSFDRRGPRGACRRHRYDGCG